MMCDLKIDDYLEEFERYGDEVTDETSFDYWLKKGLELKLKVELSAEDMPGDEDIIERKSRDI